MKRFFFVCILLTVWQAFFAGAIYGQDWKTAFDQGQQLLQKAETTGKDQTRLTDAEHEQRQKLYKQAADQFIFVRDHNRRLAPAAVYYITYALKRAAKEELALNRATDAFATIKRAIDYWPELDIVPAQRFTDDVNIRYKGEKLNYKSLGSTAFWQEEFYDNYLLAMQIANKLKYYDDAKKYGLFVLSETDTLPNQNFIALAEMVDVYKNTGNPCRGIDYAMRALRKAAQVRVYTSAEKAEVSDYLKKLAVEVAPRNDCRFDKNKWAENAALALSNLYDKENLSFFVMLYGNEAYNNGRQDNELLLALAEAEHYQSQANSDLPKTNYFQQLEEKKRTLSSVEMLKLAGLYQLKGRSNDKLELQEKARKKLYWENTHIAISTNPFNLYWGQYLGAVELMLPHVSHEVRFNYNNNTRHLLWKYEGDTSEGNSELFYKGYQLSYTLKFTTHNIARKNYFYHGPQLRYDFRNYNPVNTAIAPKTDQQKLTYTMVDGQSSRYDLTYMLGSQIRSNYLFFDYYIGVGVGYKTMRTNIDTDAYVIRDDRFKKERWNNFYVPVRAGWRIGLLIK